MNKWIGIGRLTRDPDYKQTPQGTSVATFSIAINRQFNKNESDFINCVAWRQQAEFLSKYGKKGRLLAVEGRIQTRNYENKEGRKVYVTEIVADRVEFLDSKGKGDKPAGNWDEIGHEIDTDDEEPF